MSVGSQQPWPKLRQCAIQAAERAYAPYSGFRVGAAALTTRGRVVSGCNVENASYGVTLCAECGLVSQLVAGSTENDGVGERELLTHFVCVNGAGEYITPCGRCRQLLIEHAAPGMQIELADGQRDYRELLPDAFGPTNLPPS